MELPLKDFLKTIKPDQVFNLIDGDNDNKILESHLTHNTLFSSMKNIKDSEKILDMEVISIEPKNNELNLTVVEYKGRHVKIDIPEEDARNALIVINDKINYYNKLYNENHNDEILRNHIVDIIMSLGNVSAHMTDEINANCAIYDDFSDGSYTFVDKVNLFNDEDPFATDEDPFAKNGCDCDCGCCKDK